MAKYSIAVLAMAWCLSSQIVAEDDLLSDYPSECHGRLFCDVKPDSYPQELIDNWLDYAPNKVEHDPPVFEEGDLIHDDENCHVRFKMEKPFIVNSTSPKYVLQNEFFVQKLRRAECLNEGQKCFETAVNTENAVKTACKATNGEIQLYLFNPRTKNIELEKIPFPVCCSCSFDYS